MTKEVICPVCEGHGFSVVLSEYSISSHACDNCNGSGLIEVPMTNADRFRAMSDDKLEDFIRKISIAFQPWCDNHCKLDNGDNCNTCLKNWLKQPVEEQ